MTTLFSPLRFRNGVVARNRVWLAPMTNQQSHDDGALGDDELRWLRMRARGGFGVVETCASHVSRDGQAWPGELGVFDDRLVPGLRTLASALAEDGALGVVQLFHGGLRASRALIGQDAWSATAFEAPNTPKARAATESDIARVIGDFASAAARCADAGFGGVELHGAHGFLLSQFLSRTINTRSDRWGGSFANRAHLVRSVLHAVRAAVPDRFVVGVRISPEDRGNAIGLDLDESIELVRSLCEDGADFIHLSLFDVTENTKKRPSEHAVPIFRAAIPRDVVLVAAGNVWTRADADAVLARGADAVAIGRAAIANPDWARRAEDPAWEPRRPPLGTDELRERGLSEKFANYMKNWPGFVRA